MKVSINTKASIIGIMLALLTTGFVNAQGLTVTGKVTDAKSGQPLPGVNITVKGTTTGTVTNLDGKY